ncbi:MAG TPA: site-2 protease family protein, partial [Acidobacteria bacterium]|nr:site-2 protease family protein [Acidobacteriota bacterium]
MPIVERLAGVFIEIVVLLFAVSAHESAHGWVADRWGDPTARDLGRITLNPLKHVDPVGSLMVPALLAISGMPVFGWARPVPVNPLNLRDPRRAMVRVSFAGPAANLILAVISLIGLRLLRMVAPGVPRLVIDNLSAGSVLGGGALGLVVAILTSSLIINVIL